MNGDPRLTSAGSAQVAGMTMRVAVVTEYGLREALRTAALDLRGHSR